MYLLMTARALGGRWLSSWAPGDGARPMVIWPSYDLDMTFSPVCMVVLRVPGRRIRNGSSRRGSAARIQLLLMVAKKTNIPATSVHSTEK